jgi:hypothetical protein
MALPEYGKTSVGDDCPRLAGGWMEDQVRRQAVSGVGVETKIMCGVFSCDINDNESFEERLMVQSLVFFQLLAPLASWRLSNTLRHVVDEVGFQTLGVAPNRKKSSITDPYDAMRLLG